MALAACDTQPATNITEHGATLNAKGACTQGAYGSWWYDVRVNGTWYQSGPIHQYSCAQNTGDVAFLPERTSFLLKPGTTYAYRLTTYTGNNGQYQHWDANGTNEGTAYDTFTTLVEPEYDVETFEVYDVPDDPSDTAVASTPGCRSREMKNARSKEVGVRRDKRWTVTLRTRWRFCKNTGQVVKMWPALESSCVVHEIGKADGWRCVNPNGQKIRAYSLGGNPEHVIWTYSWDLEARDPLRLIPYDSAHWCASNYASGSGETWKNGRCDLVGWGQS